MKINTTTLAWLIVGTLGSNAATLLENSGYVLNTTDVRYTFENAVDSIPTALQTDDTGNGRIMAGVNDGGGYWSIGPLAPGGTKSIIVTNSSYGFSMANTSGMATDNYQVTIYVSPGITWPFVKGAVTIFAADGLRLGINSSDQYYAEVDGATIGTQTTFDWDSKGLMIQKKNGEFSFWIADANMTNWSQVGGTSNAAGVGDDFSGTHMFVKPGGGETYYGYTDTFQIQSFTPIPEPSAALLGGIGMICLLRRRR